MKDSSKGRHSTSRTTRLVLTNHPLDHMGIHSATLILSVTGYIFVNANCHSKFPGNPARHLSVLLSLFKYRPEVSERNTKFSDTLCSIHYEQCQVHLITLDRLLFAITLKLTASLEHGTSLMLSNKQTMNINNQFQYTPPVDQVWSTQVTKPNQIKCTKLIHRTKLRNTSQQSQ